MFVRFITQDFRVLACVILHRSWLMSGLIVGLTLSLPISQKPWVWYRWQLLEMYLYRCVKQPAGKSNNCVFSELVTNEQFTEYQSVVNPDWFIGFSKRGVRLPGQRWKRHPGQRQCYQFVKMDNWNSQADAHSRSTAVSLRKVIRKMPTSLGSSSSSGPWK